jgi:hypothetical protein
MSAKDREAEFARWQTSLLSRIPDQPTFAEVGTVNRVFGLEERRERALSEDAKSKKAALEAAEVPAKSDPKSADDMDVDADGDDASGKEDKPDDESAEEKGDTAKTNPKKKAGDESVEGDDGVEGEASAADERKEAKGSDDDDGKKDAAPETPVLKKVRPISLTAVPSFYDQDWKRIRLIHQELIAASAHEHARQRLEEVTGAYNAGTFARRGTSDCDYRRLAGTHPCTRSSSPFPRPEQPPRPPRIAAPDVSLPGTQHGSSRGGPRGCRAELDAREAALRERRAAQGLALPVEPTALGHQPDQDVRKKA